MLSIEDVERAAAGVPRSTEDEWVVAQLLPGRMHVARDAQGTTVLFLLGARDTFGSFLSRQSFSYSNAIHAVASSAKLEGARLAFLGSAQASRAACHVAVELADAFGRKPDASNEQALARVTWLIDLMESRWSIMSEERAKGLAGECLLLRRLVARAVQQGLPARRALEAWHGTSAAKRDFAAPGIALEVKTTSSNERVHRVGSLAQLQPHGNERVYLFSVGLRLDSSGPRGISAFVLDVHNALTLPTGEADLDARALFNAKLIEYGYDPALAPSYDRAHRFLSPHLSPHVYDVSALKPLSPADFLGGAPPSHITGIAFDLAVSSPPLPPGEEEVVLTSLLAPASPQAGIGMASPTSAG